jgi:8-oxo-dGTP diphosphatase
MAAQRSKGKAPSTEHRRDQQHSGGQALGVGVIVVRGDEVLFGFRRSPHGADTWSVPGGHLESGETVETCALRELFEETGLDASDPRVVAETDDRFPTGMCYRTIFVQVGWTRGEPVVREPEACAQWGWFRWDDPPKPCSCPSPISAPPDTTR